MARPLVLPCCEKSLCTDPGTPILNLTAEADDGVSYIGANYNGQTPRRIGGNDPGVNPPPPGFCISQDSQIVADQCAERDQVNNDDPGGQNPQPVRFGNAAQSCTSICPDGLPFIYVVAAGTYLGFSQVLVDRAALSFACNLARQNRICLSDLQDFGCVSEAYSDTLIPLGTGPFTFAIVSGALPPGLALTQNGSIGTISGTPTVAGNFTFTVRVTSANGNFMQRTYSIAVLEILNSSDLPNFTIGVPYSVQLNAVGGTAPYSFAVTDGLFPDGISMSDAGLISGTPTEGGDFPVTIAVTDADDIECSKDFNLHGDLVAPSYAICNWPYVLSQLSFVGCDPSIFPAWDGIFNKQTVNSADNGKLLYFIDQSINGNKVAASETANYPNGNWTVDCFVQVHYDAGTGSWFMPFNCTNCNVDWVGELNNNDPDNPEGVYTMVFGSGPATIQLVKVGAPAGPIPTWSQLLWGAPTLGGVNGGSASFSPSSAAGLPFDCQSIIADLSVVGAAASSNNVGGLYYSGPAQNCNMAVTWDTDPQSVFGGHGFIQIEQVIGITTFILASKSFNPLFEPDGLYNIPFTLLNTAGCTWQIRVVVSTNISHLIGAPAIPALARLTGTITNV
jgi:hypothetical protein